MDKPQLAVHSGWYKNPLFRAGVLITLSALFCDENHLNVYYPTYYIPTCHMSKWLMILELNSTGIGLDTPALQWTKQTFWQQDKHDNNITVLLILQFSDFLFNKSDNWGGKWHLVCLYEMRPSESTVWFMRHERSAGFRYSDEQCKGHTIDPMNYPVCGWRFPVHSVFSISIVCDTYVI